MSLVIVVFKVKKFKNLKKNNIMSSKKGDLYQRFFKSYRNAFPGLTGQNAQKKVNAEWSEAKVKYKDQEFAEFLEKRIVHFDILHTKNKCILLNYLTKSQVCP